MARESKLSHEKEQIETICKPCRVTPWFQSENSLVPLRLTTRSGIVHVSLAARCGIRLCFKALSAGVFATKNALGEAVIGAETLSKACFEIEHSGRNAMEAKLTDGLDESALTSGSSAFSDFSERS